MATNYTTRLRYAKQGTGDNADTWGGVLNAAVFDLVDESVSGVTSINVTTGSNITLTTNNGATDQARKMVLKLTGTPSTNISIIVPNLEKLYIIDGSAIAGTKTVTIIGSSGTGIPFSAGDTGVVYSDATNVNEVYKTPTPAAAGTPLLLPGDLKNSAKIIDHNQWLVCNGRTLDSIANPIYADLYTAIGVSYGGTSASNFNIPDYRGRVHAGQDNMGGTSANVLVNAAADSLGGTAGAEKPFVIGTTDGHALTEAENGPHDHTIPFTETVSGFSANVGGNIFVDSLNTTTTSTSGSGTPHSHGFTSGGTDDLTSPYLAGYTFILY